MTLKLQDSRITLPKVKNIEDFYISRPTNTGKIEDFGQFYDKKNFDKDGTHSLAMNPNEAISRSAVKVIDYILNKSISVAPKEKDYDELRSRFLNWFKLTELSLNQFKRHPNFKILQGFLKHDGDTFRDNVIGIIKARKKQNLMPWVEEIVKEEKTKPSKNRDKN